MQHQIQITTKDEDDNGSFDDHETSGILVG